MISYLSSIVTMSLSCTVSEILSLTGISQNQKTSRDRDHAHSMDSIIPVLKHHLAKQSTKFQVSSFSRSGDILGEMKIQMGRVTITRPFQGRFVVGVLGLVTIQQCIKFEISAFTHYKDERRQKCRNWGGFWVRGHSRSSAT